MRVKYTGPHAEVEVGPTGQYVKRGETTEVPDDVGASLVEQDTWEKAPATKNKEGS